MIWALIFWAVYGVGSLLFVVYLFRVGRRVASNEKQLIEQELERMRAEGADPAVSFAAEVAHAASREQVYGHTSRLQVNRIFQADNAHVVVQGMRDGNPCVVNLPIGLGAGVAAAETAAENLASRQVEKVN